MEKSQNVLQLSSGAAETLQPEHKRNSTFLLFPWKRVLPLLSYSHVSHTLCDKVLVPLLTSSNSAFCWWCDTIRLVQQWPSALTAVVWSWVWSSQDEHQHLLIWGHGSSPWNDGISQSSILIQLSQGLIHEWGTNEKQDMRQIRAKLSIYHCLCSVVMSFGQWPKGTWAFSIWLLGSTFEVRWGAWTSGRGSR